MSGFIFWHESRSALVCFLCSLCNDRSTFSMYNKVNICCDGRGKIQSCPHSLRAHAIIQPLLIYSEAFRGILKTIKIEYTLHFACKPPHLAVISSATLQKDPQKGAEILKHRLLKSLFSCAKERRQGAAPFHIRDNSVSETAIQNDSSKTESFTHSSVWFILVGLKDTYSPL